MAYKLLIRDPRADLDSVRQRRKAARDGDDMTLLIRAQRAWDNLRPVRRAYQRGLRFTYGDQWGDRIKVEGRWMDMRNYLTRTGNVALQMNLIKKSVNAVSGGVTREGSEPMATVKGEENRGFGELMTACLQTNWYNNAMSVVMSNQVENLMVGGLAMVRECYERRDGVVDSWTDPVPLHYTILEGAMSDPRMGDLTMVGQMIDCSFNQLCEKFATGPDDFHRFREWYPGTDDPNTSPDTMPVDRRYNEEGIDFWTPSDRSMCRVYELWTEERRPRYHVFDRNEGEMYDINADDTEAIESIKRENEDRLARGREAGWPEEDIPLIEYKEHWFMDTYWYCRFLTPQGHVLWEGESPYPDRKHPFTVLAIPYVNGMIVGYISDLIDQNMAINRILTLDDWVRRAGVKGVSFIPRKLVPSDMSYDEFAKQWTSIDGIIFYEPKPNMPDPKIFYGNPGTLNTAEVVRMMSELMESSSPATGAYRGDTPHAGTSAALYNQQTINSAIPLATFMDRFNFFFERVASKKMMLMAENYTLDRYVDVAGEMGVNTAGMDLSKVGDMTYRVKTRRGPSAMQSQEMLEEDLRQWLGAGTITWDDYLALSMRPGVDKLRARYEARLQQMAAEQAAGQAQEVGGDYEDKKRMMMQGE